MAFPVFTPRNVRARIASDAVSYLARSARNSRSLMSLPRDDENPSEHRSPSAPTDDAQQLGHYQKTLILL
jgi:hypothetical protein